MSVGNLYFPNLNNLFCHDLTLSGDLNMDGDLLLDEVHITSTNDALSISTGALIVDGGAGIAKQLHTGDTLTIHNIDDTLKYTLLSTDTAGDLLIQSSGTRINTHALNRLNVISVGDSTSIYTGALTVAGGVGIKQGAHIGYQLTLHNVQDTTKTMTQSVDYNGNASIVTNGNSININNTTQSISTSTGALIISGGVGIAGNLYVGGTMGYPTYSQSINIDTDGVYGGSASYMVTLSLTKIGTIIQMNLTGTGIREALFPAVFKSIVGAIPTLYLPSADTYGLCEVRCNTETINTVGEVHITPTGQIIISASLTGGNQNFDAGYNAGYVAFGLSWLQ